MTRKNHTTDLTELLSKCVARPNPMLNAPECLRDRLMETEADQQLGAEKVSVRAEGMAAAADTVPDVWISEWEQCAS